MGTHHTATLQKLTIRIVLDTHGEQRIFQDEAAICDDPDCAHCLEAGQITDSLGLVLGDVIQAMHVHVPRLTEHLARAVCNIGEGCAGERRTDGPGVAEDQFYDAASTVLWAWATHDRARQRERKAQ